MNLKQTAIHLDTTKIENLEYIGRSIKSPTQTEYNKAYAEEIVRQKIANSKLPHEIFSIDFPYKIAQEEGEIFLMISPELMVQDTSKNQIEQYSSKIKRRLPENNLGIIYFLPFQMNGDRIREIFQRNLEVRFVNLPYNQNSLERRFRESNKARELVSITR